MKLDTTKLEKAIEHLGIGGYNQFADCFNNFLDLALSFFCNNMDERQQMLRKKAQEDEDFRKLYETALNEYAECADGYKDPMGDMFMSRISHGDKGQFFTPQDVSTLMIMLTGIKNGSRICDPSCGSGRTLLSALEIARRQDKDVMLFGNDLSLTCSKMTLLNFLINSADGEVTCGDALKQDYENYVFFKIDKVRNIFTNKILCTYWQYTTDTVDEVNKKRQKWIVWTQGLGWFPIDRDTEDYSKMSGRERAAKIKSKPRREDEKLPTEINIDSNGQINLF